MKFCAQCGKAYEPTSNHQRFCSQRCKWQWWNDRKPRLTKRSYRRATLSRLQQPTEREKQIIIGGLMGDGCLIKTNYGVRMSICHSAKQVEYLRWKHDEVPLIFHGDIIPYRDQYHLNSIYHPFLEGLYPVFYPNDRKVVSESILTLIDALGLAVWYMDDGSFNNNPNSRQVTLCTEAFGREGTELIARWFADKWGITPHVQRTHTVTTYSPTPTERFRLVINRSQVSRFFQIVGPYTPACMAYKLPSSLSC